MTTLTVCKHGMTSCAYCSGRPRFIPEVVHKGPAVNVPVSLHEWTDDQRVRCRETDRLPLGQRTEARKALAAEFGVTLKSIEWQCQQERR